MSRITYEYKRDLNILPDVAIQNKIIASDMNQIKDAINDNDDDIARIDHTISLMRDVPLGGTVIWYNKDSIPDKFMLTNGQAISRTTYSELFRMIGTTYGSGDGNTTFNLPNQNAGSEDIPAKDLPKYYFIIRVSM